MAHTRHISKWSCLVPLKSVRHFLGQRISWEHQGTLGWWRDNLPCSHLSCSILRSSLSFLGSVWLLMLSAWSESWVRISSCLDAVSSTSRNPIWFKPSMVAVSLHILKSSAQNIMASIRFVRRRSNVILPSAIFSLYEAVGKCLNVFTYISCDIFERFESFFDDCLTAWFGVKANPFKSFFAWILDCFIGCDCNFITVRNIDINENWECT